MLEDSAGPVSERRLGGRFAVEREVGRGAVGVVYRAFDLQTQRTVALKVVAAEAGVAPEDEARLAREGTLLSNLDHPGIVKTVAFGMLEDTGRPFVAMEWLDGEDLAARQKRNPLTLAESLELTREVGEALDAAHGAGVIHRDIKPGNIFLCNAPPTSMLLDCQPKLVDFGVAAKTDVRITRTGDVVGTPAYMAPEQARGDAAIDARCDIYSLGATLFELISGRPPHVGPNAIATLARLVTTTPPRLSELKPDIPLLVESLVGRMLELDPGARPSSMREVLDMLEDASREASRTSWVEPIEPRSSRLGTSISRLVTTLVGIRFPNTSARDRSLDQLRQRGADAAPIGSDAVVAHLGARRAVGSEAVVGLELARSLARAGARVGIASGRARLSWHTDTGEQQPVGEVVDRAAALARDAQPGGVLADATTTELGRGRYEFRARDDGSAIVGEPTRGLRGDRAGGAPFVGRDAELAQVVGAFERARRDSSPILVSVTGTPGIGKSRLRREVLARLAAHADAPTVILQRAEAYGQGHALGAAADVLRAIVALPKGATIAEAEQALVSSLGPSTRDELTAQNRELLARLLANEPIPEGFDPRGSRDALWLAMTDLVLQVASEQPTIVVMEDLQWADPESIGWLDHTLGRATRKPFVLFACVRPEFWAEHRERFADRDHVRLELRPVSRRATRAIARAVLGEEASDEIVERIATQASGLPLFAEELARLTATGRSADNAPTIEAAIQASLDVLDEECRDGLGRLSVFGLTCWDSALEALGMPGAEGIIKALVAAEVLVEQNISRFTGAREWVFKHALVREVAYASLGESERGELHALAGAWLASMGEDAATVAGHYDLGGKHSAAADHWARAAQRAIAANALKDALTMAERALAFAEDKAAGFQRASQLDEAWSRLDPRASERETAVRAMEDNVHDEASAVRARGARARYDDARGSGEDISARLAEARDSAAQLGLHDEEARCSAVLAARLGFAGQFKEAEAEAKRLLDLAQHRGIAYAAVDGYQTLAIVRQTQGALSTALDARRNATSAARSAGLKEREAMLMTNLGFALTTIGARQEARTAIETGLALADAIGSQGAVRHAQMILLGWASAFGSDRQLDAHLTQVRADADTAGSSVWAAPDRANLGMLFYRGCELLRAKTELANRRALALLRMAAQAYRTAGHRDVLAVALAMWAEAERACNRLAPALELALEAAQLLEQGAPSLLNESVVYLSLYDALTDSGETEAARDVLRKALPPLLRRLHGLAGTPYARLFLSDLYANARLVALAEDEGLLPEAIQRVLERTA
ncbi:MAG TPA: protein kinase [Polyangiaceae bacterium]|nr:protein kinase [Polyangiaceae bacterium]